jgi:hypothetical protein
VAQRVRKQRYGADDEEWEIGLVNKPENAAESKKVQDALRSGSELDYAAIKVRANNRITALMKKIAGYKPSQGKPFVLPESTAGNTPDSEYTPFETANSFILRHYLGLQPQTWVFSDLEYLFTNPYTDKTVEMMRAAGLAAAVSPPRTGIVSYLFVCDKPGVPAEMLEGKLKWLAAMGP